MMDDQHDDDLDTLEDIPISWAPLERLTRDMRQASATLSDTEARYLVDTYYAMQKNRIRANNQIRAMGDAGEPHEVLVWFAAQSDHLEKQVKAALQQYVLAHPAGKWAIAQKGIGPVIAAGIIARIDIRRAPTAGHIWSFAGLTNDAAWLGGEAARKAVLQFTGGNQSMDASDLIDIAGWVGASPKWLARRVYRQITDQEIPFRGADAESDADYVARQIDGLDVRLKHVVNALSKRPWNGPLKRICCAPGTAITTRKGPKKIEDIAIGDEVLTHRARWRRVSDIHVSKYAGPMVQMRVHGNAASGPLLTTNHPVLAKQPRVCVYESEGRQRFRVTPRKVRSTQLDDAAFAEISARLSEGEKGRAIAAEVGCSEALVSMVKHGYTRQSTTDPVEWVRADQILTGWRVLSPAPDDEGIGCTLDLENLPGLHNPARDLRVPLTEDVARLIGTYLGDGFTSHNRVTWSLGADQIATASFIAETLRSAFGLESTQRLNADGNVRLLRVGSKQLQTWLELHCGKLAGGKRIPQCIWLAPKECHRGLLRGMFETDGHLGNNNVYFVSINWHLAHGVSQLLRNFGICSRAVGGVVESILPTGAPHKTYAWRVQVNDIPKFYDQIMGQFREPVTSNAAAEWTDSGSWHTVLEPDRDDYIGPVFNLEVEEDRSYVADGIAVHNCWLAGEAFTKVSNRDGAFYGHVFKERKAQEEARNRAGEFSAQARASLAGKNIGRDTDAYLWYAGCLTAEAAQTIANLDPGQRQGAAKRLAGEPGSGVEMLPPARLHLRAQRVAVKLFLSNLHEVWYFQEFGKLPPNPYPIAHGDHAHKIGVPGGDMIPGYLEARREHDRKGGA